jgi:integrase/recombinase XerD
MIESIFGWPSTRERHQSAPLLEERERYLSHVMQQGSSLGRTKAIAETLVHAVRLLGMSHTRPIDPTEILAASAAWEKDEVFRKRGVGGKYSARKFEGITRGWLRFHGLLTKANILASPFDFVLSEYLHDMQVTQGLAAASISSYRERIITFLKWFSNKHEDITEIALNQIDSYLDKLRASEWQPRSIAAACCALRNFIRFCERQGWCAPDTARGIFIPRIRKGQRTSRGPSWRDVRRLLKLRRGVSPAELRTRAVIVFCAIYGLRRSEVVNLCLSDIDWYQETFTIRRSKKGRVQQFPIQDELGEALIEYLKDARPVCSCRNVFVTIQTPYRPMRPDTVSEIINRRMKELNIVSQNKGAHSLRHACATQLLKNGSTLREIADFLGHRGINSVSIYAKYDPRSLRNVAAFSLASVG